MLVTGVFFWQVILAVHIVAVVMTFGVVFVYPMVHLFAARLDPRAMPWYWRTRGLLGQRLISPGLVLVLVAGIYLASDLHQWGSFYVQWGFGVVVIIGGISGAFYARSERKLAGLAERDVGTAGTGEVRWSADYEALSKRVAMVDALLLVLILATIYLMTVQA